MLAGIELEGRRVLVVGLERTGLATARFCLARGARVAASELRPEAQVAAAATELRARGVAVELGGHRAETFLAQDLIVPSPGVPYHLPPLDAARARGIPVWSEIELAARFLEGRLVAVTGSNGKTTTTALLGHILVQAGLPALVGGNIGAPAIGLVEASSPATVTVLEVSSFQLEATERFRPHIALLLNLTPDHLDRYLSFEEYALAKARLFANQRAGDFAVLNADDPEVARRAPAAPQGFWFSRANRVAAGAYLRDGQIFFRREGEETPLATLREVPLRGEHNVENVLAAAAAAWLAGAPAGAIAAGIRSFPGVEHRLEYVAEVRGVEFYNDSKATNVDAVLKALDAFPGGLWVILGGKDKGGDYAPLRASLARRARGVFLIGAAAEKMAAQLEGAAPLERAGTLDRAVRRAFAAAAAGETVLLAPACASFDQFENFEHRGRVFKQLVRELEHAAAGAVPGGD
jgi:UDP-N-acetylmuramoylalanine--D-glutamate ligase